MKRGRKPLGPKLVQGLEASDEARTRLEVVLETIAGERTVTEACQVLGVSEARFHELRKTALEGALSSLEPGLPGRPRLEISEEKPSYEELSAEVRELRIELRAAHVREEIRAVMPHLITTPKKTKLTTTKESFPENPVKSAFGPSPVSKKRT